MFESLARLYAPAGDPERCALLEAGEDWRFSPSDLEGHPSAVWGRATTRQRPLARMVRFAVARERAIAGLRRLDGPGLRRWDVERLAPIGLRGRVQQVLRFGLMSGALVRLGWGPVAPRVADDIAHRAGHVGDKVRLRPSGDGSVVARLTTAAEPGAVLRLATVGGLKDVRRNADALIHLANAGMAHVPRLVRSGETSGVGWSTETALSGHPIRRLSRPLVDEVVRWASSLPCSGLPATAVEGRLELIGHVFPRWAVPLSEALGHVHRFSRDVPGIVEHGDLWAGNLLTRGTHLVGVVDWDNWHPAGVPGSDLLQLIAMARRSRTGLNIGELWVERVWAGPAFRELTTPYWARIGIPLTDELAWLVGVNWWAANVTAALRRGRQPVTDPRWVARNVDDVAPRLAGGPTRPPLV